MRWKGQFSRQARGPPEKQNAHQGMGNRRGISLVRDNSNVTRPAFSRKSIFRFRHVLENTARGSCCLEAEVSPLDLEQIRAQNRIEDVVAESFPLKKIGTHYIGAEHDSFVIFPNTGSYFWYSRGEYGDVFDFVGRYKLSYGASWNPRDVSMFLEAVRYLAQRAGLPVAENANFKKSPTWAERQLVARLNDALLNYPPALTYVTRKRGWKIETVKAASLGYMPRDKQSLIKDLALSDKWRSVIERFPADMIVYVHVEKGRLTYLSGRSIEAKRHYNPPHELIGERQSYFNYCYSPDAEQVVLVEGPADAITLAEWHIPAVALMGLDASKELLTKLRQARYVFVALDNEDKTKGSSDKIARELRRNAYIPEMPVGVKDFNQWLVERRPTAQDVRNVLNLSTSWLMHEVQKVAHLEGLAREQSIRELFLYAPELDDLELVQFRHTMAKIGIRGSSFSVLLKASKSRKHELSSAGTALLADDIPLLSPALGFYGDMAMVTVALTERTRDNRLVHWPYLLTNQRQLVRLTHEQIVSLNGREVALRAIPEGCAFLMRWRYSSIQKFLKGETVSPSAVFQRLHSLYTRYVDFRSPADSQILTLWVIGTYFYTMFPAYPYIALTGPKNSGKSTVLQVTQPLAFNMITTSDPSGPSLFRLIHQTNCTVGIDEAERYHSSQDPRMQQIRQLLNSGYKPGMPAIRVTGDDMKPQAFDVYSPKIIAAIAGLEDILASRCIPIPMRRTDQNLPRFPPAFDGAEIRHQLYILALTYHQEVYRNYFERPELHRLTNRSSELWSPLVSIAALIEEQARPLGLLDAIRKAAQNDGQLSDGKALNPREEALLQALEVMTRSAKEQDYIWLKACDVRQQVGQLSGDPADTIGSAQWIGHLMNRFQLTDRKRRKPYAGGQMYAIAREEVIDMMRRYDVAMIEKELNS